MLLQAWHDSYFMTTYTASALSLLSYAVQLERNHISSSDCYNLTYMLSNEIFIELQQ